VTGSTYNKQTWTQKFRKIQDDFKRPLFSQKWAFSDRILKSKLN